MARQVMDYCAVIRTLGKAGEKYQALLNSLANQTIPPKHIYVYIADGYVVPPETIGIEQYIFVRKGMVAQRALQYKEVDTEYILFLDDDLLLPNNFVEKMLLLLIAHHGDVISPDIFENNKRKIKEELMMTISGRMRARRSNDSWGYRVMRTAGYSYRKKINQECYESQTNAGACFLCKKQDFINTRFEDELWLDDSPYAIGEDQVLYYKMYLSGLKVYTYYNSSVIHLDAGNNLSKEKELKLLYSDFRFKTIFWYKFIYSYETSVIYKVVDVISISYFIIFSLIASLLKLRLDSLSCKIRGINDAIHYIQSYYHGGK